jgi:hypothetical protein
MLYNIPIFLVEKSCEAIRTRSFGGTNTWESSENFLFRLDGHRADLSLAEIELSNKFSKSSSITGEEDTNRELKWFEKQLPIVARFNIQSSDEFPNRGNRVSPSLSQSGGMEEPSI